VCTISAGGTLAFLSTGLCTINADQAGNSSYAPASRVTQSFSVNPVVPGAPVITSARAGNTAATVGFSAPASNGGASIAFYTVTANPGGATAVASASPITVTGLTNGVSYTFTVTATNSAGTGSASSPSNAVIPVVGAPTVPTGTFAYITHFQSNYVSVIDVPTNSVLSTITVGQAPEALAIQPGGSKVYVGNFSSNTVSVIDTASMT